MRAPGVGPSPPPDDGPRHRNQPEAAAAKLQPRSHYDTGGSPAALFDTTTVRTPYGTRTTVEIARALRDDVLEQVDEATADFWRRTCDAGIRELARRGAIFQCADLLDLGVPEPEHPSRWGARLHAAAKAGVIEPVGAEPSRRVTVRASLVRTWRGAPQ